MFVKICGITNREDAHAAVESGAGALGFIFHPPSPRYVEPAVVAEWIGQLPGDVLRVGIFVNRTSVEVRQVCQQLSLDVAQLHGAESPGDAPTGMRIWKAFRLSTTIPNEVHTFPAEAVLLDGAFSGRAFDWSLTQQVKRKFILAGGVGEHNVKDAIQQTRPWGIDVCSSLESEPGKKDHARMARFLKACQPALSTSS